MKINIHNFYKLHRMIYVNSLHINLCNFLYLYYIFKKNYSNNFIVKMNISTCKFIKILKIKSLLIYINIIKIICILKKLCIICIIYILIDRIILIYIIRVKLICILKSV